MGTVEVEDMDKGAVISNGSMITEAAADRGKVEEEEEEVVEEEGAAVAVIRQCRIVIDTFCQGLFLERNLFQV